MIYYIFLGILVLITIYRCMTYIRISKAAASNDLVDEYLLSVLNKGGKHERQDTSQTE